MRLSQHLLECRRSAILRTFGIEPFRHAPDEFAVSLTRRGLDLLACCMLITICNVRGNRPSEHDGILARARLLLP